MYKNSSSALLSLLQTDQGIKNLLPQDADALTGKDPDYATRDLFNSIDNGNFPSWTMYLQVMTFEEAEKFRFNPFDLTKVGIVEHLLSIFESKLRTHSHMQVGAVIYVCTYKQYVVGCKQG